MLLKWLDVSFAETDPVRHPPLRWIKKLAHELHLLHKLIPAGGDCLRIKCKTQCLLQLCPIDKAEGGSSGEKNKSSEESNSLWCSRKNGLPSKTSVTNDVEQNAGPEARGQGGAEWSHCLRTSSKRYVSNWKSQHSFWDSYGSSDFIMNVTVILLIS